LSFLAHCGGERKVQNVSSIIRMARVWISNCNLDNLIRGLMRLSSEKQKENTRIASALDPAQLKCPLILVNEKNNKSGKPTLLVHCFFCFFILHFFGVPHLATCIFLILYNEPELGA